MRQRSSGLLPCDSSLLTSAHLKQPDQVVISALLFLPWVFVFSSWTRCGLLGCREAFSSFPWTNKQRGEISILAEFFVLSPSYCLLISKRVHWPPLEQPWWATNMLCCPCHWFTILFLYHISGHADDTYTCLPPGANQDHNFGASPGETYRSFDLSKSVKTREELHINNNICSFFSEEQKNGPKVRSQPSSLTRSK